MAGRLDVSSPVSFSHSGLNDDVGWLSQLSHLNRGHLTWIKTRFSKIGKCSMIDSLHCPCGRVILSPHLWQMALVAVQEA